MSSPGVGDLVQADWGGIVAMLRKLVAQDSLLCAAKYNKSQWMEARVTAVSGGKYSVTYYDGEKGEDIESKLIRWSVISCLIHSLNLVCSSPVSYIPGHKERNRKLSS